MFFDPRFLKSGGTGGGTGSGVVHDTYPPGQIHTPFNWIVADSAAKAAIVPVAADVYKALYQEDTDAVYVLADDSPITWTLVGSGGSSSISAVEIPAFRAFRGTSNQALATGSQTTKVQLNAETFDSHGVFDSITNYRFQPTTPGYYQLNHELYVVAQTGTLNADNYGIIYKNGVAYSHGCRNPVVSNTAKLSGSDIVYFNGTTDYVELFVASDSSAGAVVIFSAAGTVSYFSGIRVDGKLTGISSIGSFPAFSAYATVAQAIPNGANTKLVFSSKIYDYLGNFDTTLNRFVAPVPGLYRFSVQAIASSAATTFSATQFWKNGVEYKRPSQDNSSNYSSNGIALIQLNAGDYVEAYVFTNPAVTLHTNPAYTYFDGHLVSPGSSVSPTLVATTIPAFHAYATAAQVLPAAAETRVTFSTEFYDTNNQFDLTTSTFTCVIPGIYEFSGRVTASVNNAFVNTAGIYKNGVAVLGNIQTNTAVNSWGVAGSIKLVTGDVVDFKLYTQNGLTTYSPPTPNHTYFQGVLVRADNPTVIVAETVPTPVSFSNRGGANQSLTAATDTKITFDTTTNTYNYGNGYSAVNSLFTAPKDGVYHFETQVAAPFVAGARVGFRKNGSILSLREINTTEVTVDFQCDIFLNANDYVDVFAKNPGTINTAKFSVTNFFSGYLLASGVLPTAVAPRYIETLKRTTDKSIANNTSTSVDWTTENDIVSGAFAIGQPTRITVPAGFNKAKIKSYILWNGSSTTGARGVEIYKNNATPVAASSYLPATALGNVINLAETEWLNVVPGDYFEARAYQASGGALNVICANGPTFIGSWFEAEFR